MKDAVRRWRLRYVDLFDRLVAASRGRCPLCRKIYSRTRYPSLDHRHIDGLVRGVICVQCNDKLGFLHDDAGWLLRAGCYLSSPPALALIGEHYIDGSPGAEGVTQ